MRESKDFRDYYIIIKIIGKGYFGSVYEVKTKDTNEKRAIKLIDKNIIRNAFKNQYFREPEEKDLEPYINCCFNEIKNMEIAEGKKKENENAVRFYEYFHNEKEFAIVMELCDGNILDYLTNKEDFNDKKKYEIIKQLNKTIKICVENKLNYIDLKIENILIKYKNKEKSNFIVKLKLTDDSGLKEEFNKLSHISDINKNIYINAPEILKGEEINNKCDLWSIGIIIYVLFFNKYPYHGENKYELLNQISYGEKILEKTGNSDLDDLIKKLLIEDPEKRMTWEEYFNHSYFINKIGEEEKEKREEIFEEENGKEKDYHKKYEIKKKIGESGFATIYCAKIRESEELRAIKIFDKSKVRKEFKRKNFREATEENIKPYIISFINEINHMKMVEGDNNENINTVKFYEYYDNENEFVIVMELCDDNLLSLITRRNEKLNIEEIYKILCQLNNSFKIIAKNQLIHRALNLDNILVKYLNDEKTKFIVKLKLTNDSCLVGNLSDIAKIKQANINLNYFAPELLKSDSYLEKIDLWSLGIIIYVMAFKHTPFVGENIVDILNQIKDIKKIFEKKTESPELDDLLKKLLVENPQKRLNWNQYFNHPFFNKEKNVRNYYELLKKIGESEFAIIYKAKNKETNELRAIKIFDKNKIRNVIKRKKFREPNEEDMRPYIEGFNNEINNMRIVEGKDKKNYHTVKLFEYFHTNDEFAIVMELCDESLLSLFSKKKYPFSSKKISEVLTLLNNSFKIMAKNRIVHKDLNLENILVKFENNEQTKYSVKLKLTDDSGIIKNLSGNIHSGKLTRNIIFKAPEILKREEYNEECDLWSLGVIIYVLAFKENPFNGDNEAEVLKQIVKFEHNFKKRTDNADLDDLLRKLLVIEPKNRITWNQYFNHPFIIKRYLGDFRNYYELQNKLGETSLANIYKGKTKGINEFRAIKIFDKIKIRNEIRRIKYREPTEEEIKPYIDSFNNEVNHMKLIEGVNNENINTVKFYEYFNTKNEFVIIMELCDDNLLNLFTKRKNPFNPDEIYNLLIQLNNSFKIMFENKLVHRALNLENILVKYKNKEKTQYIVKLKITNDSGIMKNLSELKKISKINGDLNYIAPEILKRENYNEECDLWSLGIIIYVLLFRNNPFAGDNEYEILEKIKNEGKNIEKTYNQDLDDLIQRLLIENPKNRLTWNQYFNHPFFRRSFTSGNDEDLNNYLREKNFNQEFPDEKSKSYYKKKY